MSYERIQIPQPEQYDDWKPWAARLVAMLLELDERLAAADTRATATVATDEHLMAIQLGEQDVG